MPVPVVVEAIDQAPPGSFIINDRSGGGAFQNAAESVPQAFHIPNVFGIFAGAVREGAESQVLADYTTSTSNADFKNPQRYSRQRRIRQTSHGDHGSKVKPKIIKLDSQ